MGVQGESLGKSNNLELLSHANNDKMVRTKLLIYYTFIVRHAKRCNCMSTTMFQISVKLHSRRTFRHLVGHTRIHVQFEFMPGIPANFLSIRANVTESPMKQLDLIKASAETSE